MGFAKLVEELFSGEAQTGFEGVRAVVQAGVNHFGVAGGGLRADSGVALEEEGRDGRVGCGGSAAGGVGT